MNPGRLRKAQRAVHLATGLLLVVHVYAPVPEVFERLVQIVFLPLLVGSGIAMWQSARIRRFIRSRRTR